MLRVATEDSSKTENTIKESESQKSQRSAYAYFKCMTLLLNYDVSFASRLIPDLIQPFLEICKLSRDETLLTTICNILIASMESKNIKEEVALPCLRILEGKQGTTFSPMVLLKIA